ncbi:B12-binding domain-containing radical SAM protein [Geopsychrobacter electrodiphilus]|uniref:B12-binding domain-containing radical SAM protein n=1 Tax=Geopsychrobacter electrodiphilus TaxID=225196 RepID=UPI00035E1AC6|nr:radical SAM protein [Geopsychrobacter electrodiphilus]
MAQLNAKNILLLHPLGYQLAAAARDISRKANIMPPLGLASIAAYLERAGLCCEILDCYAFPDADQRLQQLLREQRPALLGISCTTASFHDGVRLAQLAKAELPGLRVAFGGPHVSALKEKVLEFSPLIDYAVIGEGEQSMLELAQLAGDSPENVEGLVWRAADGGLVNNGYRRQALVLDELPFPAYHKLAGYPDAYKLPIFNYPKAPNSSCISSRGCPYSCSYCDRSVFRQTFRYNSADYLYRHLLYLKDRFGIRHINFYDDQFTFHRGRVEEFCRLMIEQPLGMTFNCAVRAEHVDRGLLQLMKAAGCWMVSLGIESGDEELLARHRQNADLDMLAETIRTIKSCGIRTKGLLMMGLPGETEASIRRSMDYVFSLPIDDFNLAKFTPFPGSPIYETIHQLGAFDEDWPRMDCMHFQFIPQGMEKAQMEKLFIEFYKSHFKRKRVLLGYLAMLWKSPDSWLRFAGSAGQFLRFALSNKRYGSS